MMREPAFLRLAIGGREITRSRVARTLWERFRGLMLAPPLSPGEALWLPACAAVHTAFVRQTIDLVFLRGRQIVRVRPRVPPWRVAHFPGADSVIEMAAGETARLGLTPGQSLEVHPDPAPMSSAP
jgi:uncharacterized membrane protein (UPF0127 family)